MGKRKNPSDDRTLSWTPVMEEKLVDALLHQTRMGNRVGGTFTTHAYDEIIKELMQCFPDKPIDKDKVKNRMKYMKQKFSACYDIFKNGGSGFAWNPTTNKWDAEKEVWASLISAHPEAEEWQDKPVFHYEKLVEIWGADRATGEIAETAREMRVRRKTSQNSKDRVENSIDDIDDMIARNEATLEGFTIDHFVQPNNNENENQTTPEGRSTASSSQKRSKCSKEVELEILKGMTRIAEAIETSTAEYVKTTQRHPIKEGEIWTHLVNLGFDGSDLAPAYLFLVENPDKLRALLRAPTDMQKGLLQNMMKN